MFKQNITNLTLLGVLLGISSETQAFMIDDFTGATGSPQSVQIGHSTGTESDSNEMATTGGTTIGGYRDIYLHTPSAPSDMISVAIVGGGGISPPDFNLLISNDVPDLSETTATATFIWDGGPDDPTTVNTSGLGSINITDGGSAQGFYLDAYYLSAGVTMTLTVWTDGGTNSDTAFVTSVAGEDLFLSFTSFSGLDFTAVSALRMDITGLDEYQAMVVSLETIPNPVPEPSTLALTGIGLLGLARHRVTR